MKIIGFVKKCTPVSLWGWFETDQGFNIRKPLGMYPDLIPGFTPAAISMPMQEPVISTQKSLWTRIWAWLINLFK